MFSSPKPNKKRLKLLPAVMAVIAVSATCLAPNPLSGQEQNTALPLAELSILKDIPVRYNGRLTDLQSVSRAYAKRWAGAESFQGTDDRQYDALQLYILLIARHESIPKIECFQLPNDTAKSLGLEPSTSGLYSFSKILESPNFQSRYEATKARTPDKEPTTEQRQFETVLSNLTDAQNVSTSHLTPWGPESGDLRRLLSTARSTNKLDVPRMAFATEANSGKWTTLIDSAIREFARTELKEETVAPNPYAKSISEMLVAVQNDDLAAFRRHSSAALDILDKRKNCTSALNFHVPANWMEVGVGEPFQPRLFSDAFAFGVPLARLESGNGRFNVQASINHFPDQTIDPRCLVNSWRLNEGLAPLTEKEFATQVTYLNGQRGEQWTTKFTTPFSTGETTTAGTIIQHPSGTWVISAFAPPELFAKEATQITSFSESVAIPGEVAEWVATEVTKDDTPKYQALAMLSKGQVNDVLIQIKDEQRLTPELTKTVRKIADDLQAQASENPLQDFKPPSNWRQFSNNGRQQVYFVDDKEKGTNATITFDLVESVDRVHTIELANLVRHSIGKPLLPTSTLDSQLREANNGVVILPVDSTDQEGSNPK